MDAGPGAEVPELARDADLLEEPDAVRPQPHQAAAPEVGLRGAGRGLLRLRAGAAGVPAAGGGHVRHGADAAAGAAAAAVRVESRAQLRSGRGRPERGGAVVRPAGRGRVPGERGGAARAATTRTPSSGTAAGEQYAAQLQQSKPYLEYLLDRTAAAHDLRQRRRAGARSCRRCWRWRRASRTRPPATSSRTGSRTGRRITESVVRDEIRKAAVERRTEVSAREMPALRPRSSRPSGACSGR